MFTMSSKLKLVSPLQMPEASPVLETDWKKCVICQVDKNEKLVCPADSKKNKMWGPVMSV